MHDGATGNREILQRLIWIVLIGSDQRCGFLERTVTFGQDLIVLIDKLQDRIETKGGVVDI